MSVIDVQIFLKEYTRALREGDASLFVGAGVSRSAGYVDWKQLLKEIADDLELDVTREADLIALAQFHVNHRGGRDRLSQLLIDEFLENVELTSAHHLIASLPIRTIWTTNYDDLLEASFTIAKKRVDVKRRPEDFSVTRGRADVTIYKMHGDRTDPANAVLTKEDYENYNDQRELFTIALKGDLARTTFLFLGFSFNDPNVLYILARVKQLLEKNGRKHYCILKPPTSDGSSEGEYECRRFTHWLLDLHRYNIQPVLIGNYDQVPKLLAELDRRAHLRDVFISGCAADFAPLGKNRFELICQTIGAELIKRGFNIISGFGAGIGDLIAFGAMQILQKNDDERIQLWPFPQTVPAGIDREAYWKAYREKLIADAGFCLVIAGNKLVNGATELSEGVRQEVDIARTKKKIVIPVGATGYVARELWQGQRADLQQAYGTTAIAKSFEIIGDANADPQAIAAAAVDIMKQLDH